MKFHAIHPAFKSIMGLVVGLIVNLIGSHLAFANSWIICHYEFTTLQINRAEQTITAQITKPIKITNDCPKYIEPLTFRPETVDYQSPLSFKKFPKVGQKRQLIYRYLDGWCKNDGNDGACRIEHYSVK